MFSKAGNLCESDVFIISSYLFKSLSYYAYYMWAYMDLEMKV